MEIVIKHALKKSGKHLQRFYRSCKYMQYFTKVSSLQWIICGETEKES